MGWAQGTTAPARRRTTIGDIARRAGVSKGSVSYALNGRPGLSGPTRQRILDIAEELGWHPDSAARALSGARADACGLVLARQPRLLAWEPFFMELISGIEAELATRSIALMLQVVPDLESALAAHRRLWTTRRVDGAPLVDLRVDDPRIDLLERLGMPAVVDRRSGPYRLPAGRVVRRRRGHAGRGPVPHAIGHRRPARVAGLPAFLHTGLRTAAFREALADTPASGWS